VKLHIGGEEAREGWKILNIQQKPGVDFIGDILDLSQFADESCDEVYASHVVEHVHQAKAFEMFKGLARVLKKGGKLYVAVPDMDVLCHSFISPQASFEMKFHIMRMMFGGQMDAYDFHYFGWNELFMRVALGNAGFASANKVQSFGLFNDTSDYVPYGFPISLNMVAVK
jgi:predicted SAM-dependent methyltransferase